MTHSLRQQSVDQLRALFSRLQLRRRSPQPSRQPYATDDSSLSHLTSNSSASSSGDLVREGRRVRLRKHVPENKAEFQKWYGDEEIARLLRHDLKPLEDLQSARYFETIILPLSARGYCFAIHDAPTDRLIGTTALTDVQGALRKSALFRIVIGDKDDWGAGYGTEATRLVVAQAFELLGLHEIRLEVFQHNPRAIATYRTVGFAKYGEHREWLPAKEFDLLVDEMIIDREMIELPLDFDRFEMERMLRESAAAPGSLD